MEQRSASGEADPGSSALVIAAIVCPVAVLVAWGLGPAIGDILVPGQPLDVYPSVAANGIVAPEPTELARFVVACLIPILVIAGGLLTVRRPKRWLAEGVRPAWIVVPGLIAALAALSWFDRTLVGEDGGQRFEYFRDRDGVIALALAAVAAIALGSASARERLRSLSRIRSLRWLIPLLVAVLALALLLPVIQTNESFRGSVNLFVGFHYVTTVADFDAVTNGATPGVDYAPEYASVLAYVLAPLFELVGYQPGAVADILVAITALILFSLYRVLWLVTRSAARAALLFVPVLGLTFLPAGEVLGSPIYNANTFQVLPIRYIGPAVVGLMLAWHLAKGRGTRSRVAIFFAASLAAISTPDFGTAAVIAGLFAFAVLAICEDEWVGEVKRLMRDALVGAVAAIALFVIFTLIRSGELPSPSLLLYFPRVFASRGFGLIPMDAIGMHWLLYLTFAGGMVLAGVRSLNRDPDRLLTGVLAFFACLGLAAGVYYVGRSNQFTLISLFPLWGMTLALLGWIALRDAASRPLRSAPAGIWVLNALVVLGLGLGVASLSRLESPLDEIDRIAHSEGASDQLEIGPEVELVEQRTATGESTAILCRSSFRIANEAGVRNASPIADPQNVVGNEQVALIAAQLQEAGGRKLFSCNAGLQGPHEDVAASLEGLGFSRSGEKAVLETGLEYLNQGPDFRLEVQEWLAPGAEG